MKRTLRKMMAAVLVAIMVMTMFPAAALADNNGGSFSSNGNGTPKTTTGDEYVDVSANWSNGGNNTALRTVTFYVYQDGELLDQFDACEYAKTVHFKITSASEDFEILSITAEGPATNIAVGGNEKNVNFNFGYNQLTGKVFINLGAKNANSNQNTQNQQETQNEEVSLMGLMEGGDVNQVRSLNILEETATLYFKSGETAKYAKTLNVEVDPADAAITWTSSNSSIVKVDQNGKITPVGNGTAIITAEAGSLSDTCSVSVVSDGIPVYVYLNAQNMPDYSFPGLVTNSSGWYTIGYIVMSASDLGRYTTTSSSVAVETPEGLTALLGNVTRYSSNASIPTEWIQLHGKTYCLFQATSGANDYVSSNTSAFHLDLYAIPVTTKYDVTVNYINENTNAVMESITAKCAENETVSAAWYAAQKSFAGFTYHYGNPETLTVSANVSKNVINLYYKINGSITVSLTDKTVTYTGTEQSLAAATIVGAPAGTTLADLKVTVTGGTGTEPGTYSATITGDAQYTKDGVVYDVVYRPATLTITADPTQIIVTIKENGGELTYTGEAQKITGYTVESISNDSYTTSDFTFNGTAVVSGTDAGTYPMTLTASNFTNNSTRFSNVVFVIQDNNLVIKPAPLTVTTPTASKTYDGTALTEAGTINGFVNGETATFATTGSQTAVGSSSNSYTLTFDKTAQAANYTVSESLGTLTVSEYAGEITVTTTGGTFTYDGQAHGATVAVSELPDGYTLETATSNATATHVADGTVAATCNTLVIKNAQGVDVTSKLNIKYVDGTIAITPATLTVTTGTDSKVYDGTALTAEGTITGFVNNETATFTVTGTRTAVGSSDNTYSLKFDKTAVASDYTVSATVGKLTITESTDEIVVTTTGGTFTYDGTAHGATVTVTGLPTGYTVTTATSNDTATHVAEGTITANCDTLVIKNAQGVDVTTQLNIRYVNGSIKITPATLTITTPTAGKTYDGTAIAVAGTINGFVNDETATFTTTGSQTAVGSSDNTYSLTFDGTAVATDYTVSATVGKLTITESTAQITVITTGGTFTYDGQAHGATVAVSTLPTGYTLVTATSNDKATHVSESAVTADCDTLVIKNVQGVDVTSKLNITYVDGSITITPATLTVTTGTGSKVYDGTALTAAGSISGFVNGETATFKVTGTQTAVGNSANTYSLTFDKTAAETDYTVSETVGKLTITETTDEIVVTTTGGTFTYDGNAHGATVAVSELPDGYTLDTATSNATATHVAQGTVTASCDTLVIKNAAGEDVTSKLNITYVNGSITITPATLTVTTPDAGKTYDGTALTAEGTITGFVNNETATFATTGSQSAVGSSANTYSLTFDKTAAESDYTISETVGTLTVNETTAQITVTTTGGTFTYDGQSHGATVAVTGVPTGYTVVTATSDDKATHVAEGTVAATCDTLVIKNAEGVDVTNNLKITYVNGSISITPATLTISTETDSKVYNGTALTANGSMSGLIGSETATFAVTGTQTTVGSSNNSYSLTFDGTAAESDYTVSETIGTLTVTQYADEIVVTTTGGTFTYDGQAHGATVTVSTLPTGYTLETATSSATATHVAQGTVAATCDTLVIKNAAGEDVTSQLNITYVDGSITITPATLTVTTPDAKKTYNGSELTAEGTVTGLQNGETVIFEVTGSQTTAGTSDNTYTLTFDGTAAESDYTVSATVGTLEVTENSAEIVVTTTGGTFTYDGQAHDATVAVSTLPTGYTLVTAASNDTATHVADGTVTADCDTLVIKNAQGVDVTGKLNITYINDTLGITPVEITLTSDSASRTYNGEALEAKNVTVTGSFVDGEGFAATVTGSQKLVGSSDNTFTYELNEGTDAKDYAITMVNGTLTVTDEDVDDALVVTKMVSEKEYKLGDEIIFTILVTNIYDEPAEVTVTEQEGVTMIGDSTKLLGAGKSAIFLASHFVTEEDLSGEGYTNTVVATINGKDYTASITATVPAPEEEPEETPEEEPEEQPEEKPEEKPEVIPEDDRNEQPADQVRALAVEKTVVDPKEIYNSGDVINFLIVVTNNGNQTEENIVVTDQMNGAAGAAVIDAANGITINADGTATIASLAAGESITLNAHYTVLRADLNAAISNTAIVTGSNTTGTTTEINGTNGENGAAGTQATATTETLQIQKTYELIVHYMSVAGVFLQDDLVMTFAPGDDLMLYSPDFDGYTVAQGYEFIYSAGLPARNMEFTILYDIVDDTVIENSQLTYDPETGIDEGIAIVPDEDGIGYDVETITEDEIPLTAGTTEEDTAHADCILHFLIMLVALISASIGSKKRKKYQKEVHELKETLIGAGIDPEEILKKN